MNSMSGLRALFELSVKYQATLAVGSFLLMSGVVKLILSRSKRLNFPVIEASISDYKNALVEGTRKVCNLAFFPTRTH